MRFIILFFLLTSFAHAMQISEDSNHVEQKLKYKKIKIPQRNKPYKIYKTELHMHVELSLNPSAPVLLESVHRNNFKIHGLDREKRTLNSNEVVLTEEQKFNLIWGENETYANSLPTITATNANLSRLESAIYRVFKLSDSLNLVLFTESSMVAFSDADGEFVMSFKLDRSWGALGEVVVFDNKDFAILHHTGELNSTLYFGKNMRRK